MKFTFAALMAILPLSCMSQNVVNDATTPLHLMKPAYKYNYGVPDRKDVKSSIDRILDYLDKTTFAQLDETGKHLKQGDFRLTSYEWGVTYSAMLRAGEVTGDARYTKYAIDRMDFLCEQAPRFIKMKNDGEDIDVLMEQVVSPDALDDCGAICCAMIKAQGMKGKKNDKLWQEQIDRYYDFIAN